MAEIKDKKIIILIVLAVAAVISLIYGITAPPKIKGKAVLKLKTILSVKKTSSEKRIVPTQRHAKRTEFTSWGRNPFASAEEVEEIRPTTVIKLALSGIMWFKDQPTAMINNEIVSTGDQIGPYTVISIKKDSVIVNDGTGDFELTLE